MKRLFLLGFLMIAGAGVLKAQRGEVVLGIKGGNNAIFKTHSALFVEAKEVWGNFAIDGGAQYNTIGRVGVAARPKYSHDLLFGRLSGEVLFDYTNQGRVNSYAIGCGASLDIRDLWVTMGYYHRTMALGGDMLYEPFNIYYELGVRCLPKVEQWDLNFILTNSRIFELERHYQPSVVLEGWWYPLNRLGVQVGINYKPAGMFHISSDYYQLYANIGVCCRW